MENVEQQLSSVLVSVHQNDDHTSNDNAGGSDVVNRQQEQVDVQDPILETDDDDDDDDDDDEEECEGEGEQDYEEYEGEGEEEQDYEEYEEQEYQGEYEGESDNESCTSCVSPKRFEFFCADGLVELPEGDKDYNMITEKFFADLGELGKNTTVLAVQKNMFFGPTGQARMESFQIFTQAMAKKRQGHANVKCAWYGSSKDEISGILSYGFGKCEKHVANEQYGLGIYLTPQEASVDRIMSSPIDENGIRHVLLCRVILGNLEQVRPGSEQFHPSSEQFDTGVDNLFFPKKYIVWSTNMNTHIFPEHVISFRAPISLEGSQRPPKSPAMKPNSAWMPFGTLIMVLSRCLHPGRVCFLKKHHAAFRERKITRAQLIQIVRQTAGDNLLAKVIKACKAKCGSEASTSGGP